MPDGTGPFFPNLKAQIKMVKLRFTEKHLYVILLVFLAASVLHAACPVGDMNNDCRIDISDFAIIADLWMTQTPLLWFDQEKGMNLGDLQIFADNWLNAGSIPIISEFLASNGNLNFDEDGDSPDWIEIFNPTAIVAPN